MRGVRRRAGQEPRDPDRPDGQPAPRRRAAADVASGPAPSSPSTTWSRRSASTPPATRWPATAPTPTSTSTSTCGPRQTNDNPVFYVQYAHARVCRDPAQRRRPRDRAGPGRLRPEPARRTRRRASCCGRSPSSRGWSPAPPSCASRTGSRATSRTRPAIYHRFYDNCRVLPMGDEEVSDLHRGRLVLVDATRTVLANGLGLLGVSAPSGCEPDDPRSRLGARARSPARPGLAARARRPQRPGPAPVVADRAQGRRRAARRRAVDPRAGRRGQHPGVRPRRGRLPGPGARLPRRVLRLRRLLRRQGVPLHRGRAVGGRGGSLPRRLLRRRADRRPAGRLRPGPDRLPRQQQDGDASCAARSPPASAGSSSTPSTRSSGSRRSPPSRAGPPG